MISQSDYLIGVLLIAWVWGGCVLVGVLIVRAIADNLSGSARAAAVGIVAAASLVAVHVIPGVLAIAGAAALVYRRQGLRSDREPRRPAPPSSLLSSGLAFVAVVALAGRAIANVWSARLLPPSEVDINGIHLPTV